MKKGTEWERERARNCVRLSSSVCMSVWKVYDRDILGKSEVTMRCEKINEKDNKTVK